MVSIKLISKKQGLYEWIIVRLSAIIITSNIIYLCSFVVCTNHLSYEQWRNLFNNNITKIFNFVTLLFILIHAWIGIRHILEDYIKSIGLRRLGIRSSSIILYMYLLLGIIITWGI